LKNKQGDLTMALTTQQSNDGKTITLHISGRFDFSVHQEFRQAYEQTSPVGTEFIIDMSDTEYMDSSALGMLLLLREHAGGDHANVKLINTRKEIRDILKIANFHNMFEIRE